MCLGTHWRARSATTYRRPSNHHYPPEPLWKTWTHTNVRCGARGSSARRERMSHSIPVVLITRETPPHSSTRERSSEPTSENTPCRVAEGLGVSGGRRGQRGGDAGVHSGPHAGVPGERCRLVSSTRPERKTERVRLGGRGSVLQRSSPPGLYRVSAGPTRCPMRVASFRRAPNSSAQRGPSDSSPQLWPEPRANADVRDRLRRPRAGRLRMSRAECHVLTGADRTDQLH